MLRAILVLVVLLAMASASFAQSVWMPAEDLSIPAAGTVYRLAGTATAIRIKAATAGLSWRGYKEFRAASGELQGYFPSCPADTTSGQSANFDNHMLPAAADTTLKLDSEAVQAWNVYNNVEVDIIVFHNSTGGAIVASLEAVR